MRYLRCFFNGIYVLFQTNFGQVRQVTIIAAMPCFKFFFAFSLLLYFMESCGGQDDDGEGFGGAWDVVIRFAAI